MSIPRRARIFGQPTKLQRDALIGGQWTMELVIVVTRNNE